MPSNLTDVDEFTEPVVVPNDTEPANVASVIQGFQPLANRTRNNKNRLDGVDMSLVSLAEDIETEETARIAADNAINAAKVEARSARFPIAAQAVSSGVSVTLGTPSFADTGITRSDSNRQLNLPAGTWLVTYNLDATSSSGGLPAKALDLHQDGSLLHRVERARNEDNVNVPIRYSESIVVRSGSSIALRLFVQVGVDTVAIVAGGGTPPTHWISVTKVSP